VKIEAARDFVLPFVGSSAEATAFLRDVLHSLARVRFIDDLRLENQTVLANLLIDVPVLGEQRLDFASRLELHPEGANLIAQPRTGKAWAEVSGQGRVRESAHAVQIHYALQIVVHLELPVGEKWGSKAFEKMVQATAKSAVERLTLEFGRGVTAGMNRE
jgi:Protein of unknown function (DUF3809)